jgi:hypothetical protein
MIFFDLSVHIVHRPCRSDLQKQYSIELSEAIIAMLAASSCFGAQSDLIKHNGDARP